MHSFSRVAALAAVLVVGSVAQAATYVTGFEAPDYTAGTSLTGSNGWASFTGTGNAGTIESGGFTGGTQGVKFLRNANDSANYGATITHDGFTTTPENPIVRIEWDMLVLGGTTRSDLWGVGAFDGPNNGRMMLGVNQDDKLTLMNGQIGTVVTSVHVTRTTWQHYRMDLNYQTKKADIYLGTMFVGQWSMLNGGATHMSTALYNRSFSGTDGAIYDNLSVTTPVPEPATMAALGLGAVAMIRRRKKLGK